MSKKTRGQLDLKPLRELVGASKPLPQYDFGTLRDVLAAGIFLKESLSNVQDMSQQQLSLNLTEQLLAVYHKANSLFKPGDILITHRAIAQKIDNAWTKAILIVNKRAKVNKSTKDFIDKMDKLFNIFYCKCEIVNCLEKGCKDDCMQGPTVSVAVQD